MIQSGDSRLLIGDLAEQVGLAPSALRYYESAGLLAAEARTDAGYRVYRPDAAHRVRFIRRAQSLGLKLSEIRSLIDAPRGTRESERARLGRVIASKIGETHSRIARLRALAQELRGVEAALKTQPPPECGHLGDCACWLLA